MSKLMRTPSLSKLVDATAMLVDGDEVSISASNHKYVTIEDTGRLIALGVESEAAKFRVERSGSRVCFKTGGKYVARGPDGCLYASATSPGDGLSVSLQLASSGSVVLDSGGNTCWVLRPDEAIDTEVESALGLAMEFGVHFTPKTMKAEAKRLKLLRAVALTPCEIATAGLLWQIHRRLLPRDRAWPLPRHRKNQDWAVGSAQMPQGPVAGH